MFENFQHLMYKKYYVSLSELSLSEEAENNWCSIRNFNRNSIKWANLWQLFRFEMVDHHSEPDLKIGTNATHQ